MGKKAKAILKKTQRKLYWIWTPKHHEDWFVISTSKESAKQFFCDYEGFDIQDDRVKAGKICDVNMRFKGYNKRAFHAQIPMLKALGFVIVNSSSPRVVIYKGVRYREGCCGDVIAKSLCHDKSGVYIIRLRDQNYFKIGRTKNLYTRIDQIRRNQPFEIEILLFIQTPREDILEAFLHKKYKNCCVGGEWFLFNRSDFELLAKDVERYCHNGFRKYFKYVCGREYPLSREQERQYFPDEDLSQKCKIADFLSIRALMH
jgi:hypothetical protein